MLDVSDEYYFPNHSGVVTVFHGNHVEAVRPTGSGNHMQVLEFAHEYERNSIIDVTTSDGQPVLGSAAPLWAQMILFEECSQTDATK